MDEKSEDNGVDESEELGGGKSSSFCLKKIRGWIRGRFDCLQKALRRLQRVVTHYDLFYDNM